MRVPKYKEMDAMGLRLAELRLDKFVHEIVLLRSFVHLQEVRSNELNQFYVLVEPVEPLL